MNTLEDDLKARTSTLKRFVNCLFYTELVILVGFIVYDIFQTVDQFQYVLRLIIIAIAGIFYILPIIMFKCVLDMGLGNNTYCFDSALCLTITDILLRVGFTWKNAIRSQTHCKSVASLGFISALLYCVLFYKGLRYRKLQKQYFLDNKHYYNENKVHDHYQDADLLMEHEEDVKPQIKLDLDSRYKPQIKLDLNPDLHSMHQPEIKLDLNPMLQQHPPKNQMQHGN